ncbi:MAG: hypothetical protein PCFJNLEI_01297 [Verrucomicrobiae bacterium]|nr:hypothetical protein [Verrucomicrobiae bacterium]
MQIHNVKTMWVLLFRIGVGVLSVLALPVWAEVTINATTFTVGATAGNNTVNTNWIGSAFTITGPVLIGTGAGAGNNTVTVSNFVITANAASLIGNGTSNNLVTVLTNTSWNLGANTLAIGTSGTGNVLTINGGTVASSASLNLFSGSTTKGNSLIITNGGWFITTGALFRYAHSSSYSNSITVTGVGSVWSNNAQTFDQGSLGGDRITIANGGLLVAGGSEFDIGFFTPDERLTITGTGSVARIVNNLIVGQNAASNAVVVANGGKLVSSSVSMGGAAGGDWNTLMVTGSGSVFSNLAGGSTTALRIGIASGRSNSMVVSQGGFVYNDGDLTIGNNNAAFGNGVMVTGSGSVLTNTGSLIVGNFLTVPTYNFLTVSNGGRAFFGNAYVGGSAANGAANSLLTVTGTGSVFQVASAGVLHLGGNLAAGTNNSVLVNHGGVLAANTLTIRAGSTGNTISNVGGVYQFSVAPTVTPVTPGNIAITDGTISFRATAAGNVATNAANQINNIRFAGANTFMLDNASNTTAAVSQTYRFDAIPGNPSNYVNLVLVNGTTAYGNANGANITIGTGGLMLVSNTTATISGLVTNQGTLNLAGARATFQSRVYNNGTSTMLNSIGTFNSGVINAGHWLTDPTTNVFAGFGYTNTTSGVINMAAGDVYVFTNTQAGTPANFINVSTNQVANNLLDGKVLFSGGLGLTQTVAVAGQDLGPATGSATNIAYMTSARAGFVNNFALGTLEISNFSTVRVTDAFLNIGPNDFQMAGLYLENLFMGTDSLLIIDTNVQVYFINSNNWSLANIRLVNNQSSLFGGDLGNYDNTISGLHQVVVIPEPSVLLLSVAGLMIISLARRRTRQLT